MAVKTVCPFNITHTHDITVLLETAILLSLVLFFTGIPQVNFHDFHNHHLTNFIALWAPCYTSWGILWKTSQANRRDVLSFHRQVRSTEIMYNMAEKNKHS